MADFTTEKKTNEVYITCTKSKEFDLHRSEETEIEVNTFWKCLWKFATVIVSAYGYLQKTNYRPNTNV